MLTAKSLLAIITNFANSGSQNLPQNEFFFTILLHAWKVRAYDVVCTVRREGNHKFADCVVQAYTMAESIRLPLVCLSLVNCHCVLAAVYPDCVSVGIDVCEQIEQCQKIKAQEVKVAVDPCEC